MIPHTCPRCGYTHNRDSNPFDDTPGVKPEPGDIGICLACGAPCEIMPNGTRRWMEMDEVKTIDPKTGGRILLVIWGILTARPARVMFFREH